MNADEVFDFLSKQLLETNKALEKYATTATAKMLDHQGGLEQHMKNFNLSFEMIEKIAKAVNALNARVAKLEKSVKEIRKTPLHD